MFSEIWQTEKNFCDLEAVKFFPSCQDEIRVSFFSMEFFNTTSYFCAGLFP